MNDSKVNSVTSVRGFDPASKVEWTAQTEVEGIQKLVQDREVVFAKHRQFSDSIIDSKSSAKLDQLLKEKPRMRSYSARYKEFCVAVNVPLFPMSISTIALFLFAKCSFKNGFYRTAQKELMLIRKKTSIEWEGVESVTELEDSEQVEMDLNKFMNERETTFKTKASSTRYSVQNPDDDSASDHGEVSTLEEEDSVDSELPQTSALSASMGTQSNPSWNGVIQRSVPGLPQPGERFATANELLVASYRALLPIYGHGVSMHEVEDGSVEIKCGRSARGYSTSENGCCDWKIKAVSDSSSGGVVVDRASSFFFHNHGPSSKIEKHPTWRPTIKNAIVRQAFGMKPLVGSVAKNSRSRSTIGFVSSKRARLDVSDQSTTLVGVPIGSLTQVAPQQNSASSVHATSAQIHTLPTSTLSNTLSSRFPAAPPSNSSSAFLPELKSFLQGLHPSLSYLASPLLASGIDSLKALISFSSLGSTMTSKFLQCLFDQAQKKNELISLDNLELLQKLMEEAKSGDYVL